MVPENKLLRYVLGKDLVLLQTSSWKHGYIWECKKAQSGPEVCPRCAGLCTRKAGKAKSLVRDEPVYGNPIWIRILKHRYYCPRCRKPFTESVPGIFPRRRTTQRLRKAILKDCHDVTDLKRVSRRNFCSRALVGKIFYEQMEIKLRERRNAPWPRVLGIDEHRFKRGENGFAEFVTMFTDVGRRRAFEMGHSKSTASLIEQVSHIHGRDRVEVITMDLARGYRSLAEQLFPQARIVADKFHVLRLITPALIRERKNIHGHRQDLGVRRRLLMNREKLAYYERSDLDRYLSQHPKLNELYRYKERLSQFYRIKGFERAKVAFEKLTNDMKGSEYEEIKRLRRTLITWQKEVLEYFRSRFTNAFTEAMNSIAKLVQRRGCG